MLNVSVRAVSSRAQPLSGSRAPPSRTAAGPQPYGSATTGSWSHSPQPTTHPHHHRYAKHSRPSTPPSATTSPPHAYRQHETRPTKTRLKRQNPRNRGSLAHLQADRGG